jgi:hypothetical protein
MSGVWRVDPTRFGWMQIACIGTLVVGGALAYAFRDIWGHGDVYGFVPMFDVGNENGLATFFSVQNLLIAALLSYLLSINDQRKQASRWKWLACVFAYLALDEATSIHEKFERLGYLLGPDSLIQQRHAWLLFGFPFALLCAALFLPLLYQLPRNTALLVALAGGTFALGSLGFELLGSLMIARGVGAYSFAYDLRRLAEETLEMSGIALYNWTSIRLLCMERTTASLVLGDELDGRSNGIATPSRD